MAEGEPRSERDRWRHRHAKDSAKSWRSAPREITGGLITGAIAGGGSAAVSHIAIGWSVLIGVIAIAVGAYLPWTVAYLAGLVLAGGRVTRERLSEIHRLLTAEAGTLSPSGARSEGRATVDQWVDERRARRKERQLPKPIADLLAEHLLVGDTTYKKIDSNDAVADIEWDNAKQWIEDLEEGVRADLGVSTLAELRVYRRSGVSYMAYRTNDQEQREITIEMRRYLDWIEDKLQYSWDE